MKEDNKDNEMLTDLALSYLHNNYMISVEGREEFDSFIHSLNSRGVRWIDGRRLEEGDVYEHSSIVHKDFSGKIYFCKIERYSNDPVVQESWMCWDNDESIYLKSTIVAYSEMLNPDSQTKLKTKLPSRSRD